MLHITDSFSEISGNVDQPYVRQKKHKIILNTETQQQNQHCPNNIYWPIKTSQNISNNNDINEHKITSKQNSNNNREQQQ